MTPITHPTEEIIRVLFIQDDPAVAEMYKQKLELDGYQVEAIVNDDRVLEEAGRTKPDMVCIDLRVRDDQGFATPQRLRSTAGTRELPVIILSNRGPARWRREASRLTCSITSSERKWVRTPWPGIWRRGPEQVRGRLRLPSVVRRPADAYRYTSSDRQPPAS